MKFLNGRARWALFTQAFDVFREAQYSRHFSDAPSDEHIDSPADLIHFLSCGLSRLPTVQI
jgi:hypothetical protein